MSEPKQLPIQSVPEAPTGMAAMMERLALNPDLPVEKLEKLLDMQVRIMAIEAEKEYAAAMARVQAQLPKVKRDRKNDQTNSMYSTLEAIAAAIKPIYTAEGFSMSFSEAQSPKDQHVRVVGVLRHRDGHKTEHYRDVAIDATGIAGKVNKTQTHAEASSITYGRRYVTCLAFDVSTGDDNDGNGVKDADKVTAAQVVILENLIKETRSDRAKFLQTLQVEELEELPSRAFNIARAALRAKKGPDAQ
jgi:hypothetical protein